MQISSLTFFGSYLCGSGSLQTFCLCEGEAARAQVRHWAALAHSALSDITLVLEISRGGEWANAGKRAVYFFPLR